MLPHADATLASFIAVREDGRQTKFSCLILSPAHRVRLTFLTRGPGIEKFEQAPSCPAARQCKVPPAIPMERRHEPH